MALATAVTASSWPTTRWCSRVSMCTSFSISPSSRLCTGIPVQLATTSATSSAETSSFSIGEPDCCSSSSLGGLLELPLELRQLAVGELGRPLQVAVALRPLGLAAHAARSAP